MSSESRLDATPKSALSMSRAASTLKEAVVQSWSRHADLRAGRGDPSGKRGSVHARAWSRAITTPPAAVRLSRRCCSWGAKSIAA